MSKPSSFEEFSDGYYLGQFIVVPGEVDLPTINDIVHENLQYRLYDGAEKPIVMKMGHRHFTVSKSADVATDEMTCSLPFLETLDFKNPPTQHEVLLAKADRAEQIIQMMGEK